MKRRVLSLVLVLSLLIGAAVRPQRADAVVATATVAAASAAAILTACGVSYWASSQTDAINYISGKLEDYLTSIEVVETPADWLGITGAAQPFTVITGGAIQFTSAIANKLLGFVRWFAEDEGIESGGTAVGEFVLPNGYLVEISPSGHYNGTVDVKLLGDNRFSFNLNGYQQTYSYNYLYVDVYVPAIAGNTCWLEVISSNIIRQPSGTLTKPSFNLEGDTSYWASTAGVKKAGQSYDDTWKIRLDIGNYGSDIFTGTVVYEVTTGVPVESEATAKVTPTDFVNIPAPLDLDGTFTLNPSVMLAEGDSVDTATEAILEGITSEDGLSSTVEDTPDTSWGWLYTLLVNIAEAITDGVADIKQAVLGLADSIYSKFTTVLQDIITGISTIVNSISSAVSQLLSAIQALPTTIYSQFTQVLHDIKTGIQGIAFDIYTDIINALTYVFVPSQTFIDTYVASLYATFDNHFSILSYPFSILGQFITRATGIGSPEPIFSWGNVYEPFSGKLLIGAGSYNLNSMLSSQNFAYMYQIYMIVIKGFMSFWFLTYLYNWFCDVFKMREVDYSLPEVDDV